MKKANLIFPRICFCVFWGTVFVASAASVRADESLRDRFRKEAPKKWAEFRGLVLRTEGIGKESWEHTILPEGTKTIGKGECSYVLDGPNLRFLHQVDSDEANDGLRCEVVNEKYSFDVSAGSDGIWVLQNLRMDRKGQLPPDLIGGKSTLNSPSISVVGDPGPYGTIMKAIACRGMVLSNAWFPRMVQDPAFELKQIIYQNQSQGLVKVQFSYKPTNPERRNDIRSGMVVLDTNRYWLIREAKVDASWMGGKETGVISITNEYDDHKMPFPVIKRQVEHISVIDGERRAETETIRTFEIQKLTQDKKQFMMSAFGFPEPEPGSSPSLR